MCLRKKRSAIDIHLQSFREKMVAITQFIQCYKLCILVNKNTIINQAKLLLVATKNYPANQESPTIMAHFLNNIALCLPNYKNIICTSLGSSLKSTNSLYKHYKKVSNIPHYHKLNKNNKSKGEQEMKRFPLQLLLYSMIISVENCNMLIQ